MNCITRFIILRDSLPTTDESLIQLYMSEPHTGVSGSPAKL